MSIANFNNLDFLLLFVLFLGAIIGTIRGIRPQLMSAASIWLALLAALWTYRLLSVNIFIESEIFNRTAADTMAFMIMFLVFFNAIRAVIKYLTQPPEEKKRKPKKKGQVGPVEEPPPKPFQKYVLGPLFALGGMIMGIILTSVWTAILLGVLQFFYQFEIGGGADTVGVSGRGLANQLSSSALLVYFNQILFVLERSLAFFVFDAEADILRRVICRVFPNSC